MGFGSWPEPAGVWSLRPQTCGIHGVAALHPMLASNLNRQGHDTNVMAVEFASDSRSMTKPSVS